MSVNIKKLRYALVVFWLAVVSSTLYVYFFHPGIIHDRLASAVSFSLILGYVVYLLLGSLRSFTLIPSTPLIIVGLLFFPKLPLFFLTLGGILISSSLVYFFSESLQLTEIFEQKHSRYVAKLRIFLQKYELPVIIAWSFFPLAPTDIICYVCGILEIDFKKFLLGLLIGEGLCCALYIFLGGQLLMVLGF